MRVIVISGGTDGMGRATLEARIRRGDEVVAIGSNPAKGRAVRALSGRVHFLQADLRSVAQTRRAVDTIRGRWPRVDALALFANRPSPRSVPSWHGSTIHRRTR
ncbi:SDR family NAD(P)-dependent oxidoreductase [Micromonospora sp. WMMD708]|uniref:SDR family NAD(P)-dependent oxidoreductase n=1 Tax=Micromonospora sp. WMMD708 TaxID=3403464 RepID=UPI003BF5B8BE